MFNFLKSLFNLEFGIYFYLFAVLSLFKDIWLTILFFYWELKQYFDLESDFDTYIIGAVLLCSSLYLFSFETLFFV